MSKSNEQYTVGWICAVDTEFVAAGAFLDEEYGDPEYVAPRDENNYKLGRIGKHNVVIAVLPLGEYGISSATSVARDMLHTFPNIRIGLMVGIGGGAPSIKHDIRLGDVVVSVPGKGCPGVFQYDFGKAIQGQEFQETMSLAPPPTLLLTAVSALKAQYETDGHEIQQSISDVFVKKPRLRKRYSQPDPSTDRLFPTKVVHPVTDVEVDCDTICVRSASDLVTQRARDEDDDIPTIHYGLIASANQLMKNATIRDKLARENNVLCFEMEAAGLMNRFPCLVIRGICDYSDTHKNKQWQGWAAMTAAAYAKDVLRKIVPSKVEAEKKLVDRLDDMIENITAVRKRAEDIHGDNQIDRIKHWLSAPDPSKNFNAARELHYQGTGEWFLSCDDYSVWQTERNSFLWLHGIPGCGKTILSSAIISDLQNQPSTSQKLLYFYFDFNDTEKQSLDKAIRSLIMQLYHSCYDLRKIVNELHLSHSGGGRQPDRHSLSKTFLDMARRTGEIWLVIDALDECPTRGSSNAQHGVLDWIQSLRKSEFNVHTLVTSRPDHDIKTSIQKWPGHNRIISVESSQVEDDINTYIKARIKTIHRFLILPKVQKEMETILSNKADGMFRWAACQLDVLQHCLDRKSVLEELNNLPQTLNETYERILKNVKQQHLRNAKRLLQFLIYSDRPLRLEEAIDALAVDVTKGSRGFYPENRMPDGEEIVEYCSSLVTLTKIPDEEDATRTVTEIKLAHSTVKEYLMSNEPKQRIADDLGPTKASLAIVDVCLSYLLDLDHSIYPRDAAKIYHLARYSAQYWYRHARTAEYALKAPMSIVSEFFASVKTFNFAYQLHGPDQPWRRDGHGLVEPVNALYFASYTGLLYSVQALLHRGAHVNAQGGKYENALQAAARKGHREIVDHLLARGADINARGGADGSALQAAARQGHKDVVRVLLRNRADVNAQGGRHGTALQVASEKGHVEIVRMLLRERVDINARGRFGNAYELARAGGHQSIVDLLIDNGADL